MFTTKIIFVRMIRNINDVYQSPISNNNKKRI